jgi:uncharacterized membrane protein
MNFVISRKVLGLVLSSIGILLLNAQSVVAQSPAYWQGEVSEVVSETSFVPEDGSGESLYYQQLLVRPLDSDDRNRLGEQVEVDHGSELQPLSADQVLRQGERGLFADSEFGTSFTDSYRLPALGWLFGLFVVLVLVVSGVRGGLSVVGIGISIAVIGWWLIPEILAGGDPVMLSLGAGLLIGAVTIYLSHGWNRKSHLSLTAIMLTLGAVAALSLVVVESARLFGFGSEEAAFLAIGETAAINMRGLFLGGVLLGALGVLDDITISQISTVAALRRANPKLSSYQLFQVGMSVGKDHVASLTNTLVLAYAGANLPLFLLFHVAEGVPLWVQLNSEYIAEEIVRTLVGSAGLVLAVPIATGLAAVFLRSVSVTKLGSDPHDHHH